MTTLLPSDLRVLSTPDGRIVLPQRRTDAERIRLYKAGVSFCAACGRPVWTRDYRGACAPCATWFADVLKWAVRRARPTLARVRVSL